MISIRLLFGEPLTDEPVGKVQQFSWKKQKDIDVRERDIIIQ